jgi:hypothetical protein
MTDPRDRLGELLHVPLLHGVWDIAGVEQVAEGWGSNAVMQVGYAVPDGKVFYLTTFLLSLGNQQTAERRGGLRVTGLNDAGTQDWQFYVSAGTDAHVSMSFPAPVKILAGGTIATISGDQKMMVEVSFTGYTLPVPG